MLRLEQIKELKSNSYYWIKLKGSEDFTIGRFAFMDDEDEDYTMNTFDFEKDFTMNHFDFMFDIIGEQGIFHLNQIEEITEEIIREK